MKVKGCGLVEWIAEGEFLGYIGEGVIWLRAWHG